MSGCRQQFVLKERTVVECQQTVGGVAAISAVGMHNVVFTRWYCPTDGPADSPSDCLTDRPSDGPTDRPTLCLSPSVCPSNVRQLSVACPSDRIVGHNGGLSNGLSDGRSVGLSGGPSVGQSDGPSDFVCCPSVCPSNVRRLSVACPSDRISRT